MFQYLQMFGDGLKAHLERLRQFTHRGLPGCQSMHDGTSCRIREGGEHGAEPAIVDIEPGVFVFNHQVA